MLSPHGEHETDRSWNLKNGKLEIRVSGCVCVCACSVSESVEKYIDERNNKISATLAAADQAPSNAAPLHRVIYFRGFFLNYLFIYLW